MQNRTFVDPDEMLRESPIDAVVVATDTASHASLVIKALESGAVSYRHNGG